MSFLTAFALRTRLALLNKRNAKKLQEISAEEKDQNDETPAEIPDNDYRYVFMT